MKQIILLSFLIGFQFFATGQNLSEVKTQLSKKFPADSTFDGEDIWVFYENAGNIEKINKSIVQKYLKGSELYQATLTHFLGHHIEDADYFIIYNHKSSELEVFPPIAFDSSMLRLLSKFNNTEFRSKAELKKFISQIQEIMLIGSPDLHFENTEFSNNEITFDLMETESSDSWVWRKMKVKLNGNRILEFVLETPDN